ncbi:hypothetical protein D9M71_288160 [compost metagenome]
MAAEDRQAAVVVHVVGAELGIQLVGEVAHGEAVLAAVTGIPVPAAADDHALVRVAEVHAVVAQHVAHRHAQRAQGAGQGLLGTQHSQVAVAAIGDHVRLGEEGAAVVDHRLVPLQLVEGLGGQAVGEVLRQVEHVHRHQRFLQLGARAAQGGNVDRVDRADAVLDEGALAPVHHLLAKAHGAGLIGDAVVVIDEGVEQLRAGGLGAFLAAIVVDVLEQAVLVLQLEVVPVLAAQEDPGVLVFQFEVMHTLEDLREGLALLEVQVAVVGGLRQAAAAVVDPDEVLVRALGRPTGADGQRRVERTLDFPNVEADGGCGGRQRGGQADGQRQFSQAPELLDCCHRRYSMCFLL